MEKEALKLLLESVLFNEILVQSLNLIKSKLKNSYFDTTSNDDGLVEDMSMHLKNVYKWAHFATEIEFITDKITNEVYIDLDYYVTPRSSHPEEDENSEKLIESKLIDTVFNKTDKDIAIIGESGMGKTTSMKMIALKLMNDHEYLPYNFPIVVRLREVNFPSSYPHKQEYYLTQHIQNILGLKFANRKGFEEAKLDIEILSKYVISYLDSLNALPVMSG